MSISLHLIRKLEISSPTQLGRPAFISAASGLVLQDQTFFIIADDELVLSQFSMNPAEPGSWIQLWDQALPLSHKERKKAKPDLESLLKLPESIFGPSHSLLAIPSGSTTNRNTGAWIENDTIMKIDFSNLYQHLRTLLPELNIEGAAIQGKELKLFQRGNGSLRQNAVINLKLDGCALEMKGSNSLSRECFSSLIPIHLGKLRDVDLSFTDATADHQNRIWFLAACENSNSTYDDGLYGGAILGCLNSDHEIIFQEEIDSPVKPEGLCLDPDHQYFYVVTDADQETEPALLLKGKLPEVAV